MKKQPMSDLPIRLSMAVKHFWKTRGKQQQKQGSASGVKDSGTRGAVTGGKQLSGIVKLAKEFIAEGGIQSESIYTEGRAELTIPGFFRPTKNWDLIVVLDGNLVAAVEFKSQVGSFGNNFNNRAEESIGNATDLWTAYREKGYACSPRPWLGYFILVEDCPNSREAVALLEKHFNVFPEFKQSSYIKRYELLCQKLMAERLYDGACLIVSSQKEGKEGKYLEPNSRLSFEWFVESLRSYVVTAAKLQRKARSK